MTSILLTIVIAPAIYWILGAPFLLAREPDAMWLAPLLGGAVAGLVCEAAFMMGWSAKFPTIVAIVGCAVWIAWQRPGSKILGSLRPAYLLYLAALVPAVTSPFPILGIWNGDWFFLYKAGQQLWTNSPLSAESLQRPPLFGAAAAPLWLFADGLAPYQIYCTIMSAAALGAVVFAGRQLWPKISPVRLLAPLVLSIFFLHHTAACWGKSMAAGMLVAACAEAYSTSGRKNAWWAAIWFALAVAVHQSSIIYAPLLVIVVGIANNWNLVAVSRAAVKFAICGILLVGIFELWTIHEYGLAAKLAANPSVSQRDPNTSFAANTLLVILSSIVGWSPILCVARWLHQPDMFAMSRVTKESFWLATSWLQVSAGTMIGAYLPLILAGGSIIYARAKSILMNRQGILIAIALVIAMVLNGMLSPFLSPDGTMQNGLVGVGLGGFLLFGAWLAEAGEQTWFRAIVFTLVLGTLPWLALNFSISAGLHYSAAFRSAFADGSEGDWQRVVENGLAPLGITWFPMVQFIVVGAVALIGLWHVRRPWREIEVAVV